MKTPRNLQEYFAKQDAEMEKLLELKAAIELLQNVQRVEKLMLGLEMVKEAVHGKKTERK
tara:strand:+ start:8737 stop:8916 length:180 start_codon:yes stop_codon:yes gene_type:complete